MVVICKEEYNWNHRNTIDKEFDFELDHFQKYAIEAIDLKKHVLVTAHTGSGKTLPAEYAIEKFCKEGKKVIYTSPIKSLSNQKYHEFTKKFPDIEIGILTGDIKFNPNAECLIMTTEILRNKLFENENNKTESNLSFDIDIKEELACVIFDEIHYINDAGRGKVWEETIIQLPNTVQMIMLSATIDKPEKFGEWIEINKEREVWITSTTKRNVPLIHYSFIPISDNVFTKIPKKDIDFVMAYTNKPIELKNNFNYFNEENFKNLSKMFNIFHNTAKNTISLFNYNYSLNQMAKFLKRENQTPAICFVFNRRNVENFASKINENMFNENETKLMSKAKKKCIKILRKLKNYEEYIKLPEFDFIVKLMEKGISIHHAGLLPIFREMIEIMFDKGYVKLLFCTETFAVGINLPTKSVVFTNIEKWDGTNNRYLLSHEYTQMAGRAGRRGLDKIGRVYHLNTLFNFPNYIDYKNMLSNKAQTLISKFDIYPNLILKLTNDNISIDNFIEKSLLNNTLDYDDKEDETIEYMKNVGHNLKDILTDYGYIKENKLTMLGNNTLSLQELEGVTFSYFMESHDLNKLNENELLMFLSCFTNFNIIDKYNIFNSVGYLTGNINRKLLEKYIEDYKYELDIWKDTSIKENFPLKETHNIRYDLIEFVNRWYFVENEEQAKEVLQEYISACDVFIGEIIKAVLKLTAIINELIVLFSNDNDNVELLQKLENCVIQVSKFLINNQSLYV